MDVYVVLHWFWEGDSYLVNSFVDIAGTLGEARAIYSEHQTGLLLLYLPEEEIPSSSDGQYGSPGFYQILKKTLIRGMQ